MVYFWFYTPAVHIVEWMLLAPRRMSLWMLFDFASVINRNCGVLVLWCKNTQRIGYCRLETPLFNLNRKQFLYWMSLKLLCTMVVRLLTSYRGDIYLNKSILDYSQRWWNLNCCFFLLLVMNWIGMWFVEKSLFSTDETYYIAVYSVYLTICWIFRLQLGFWEIFIE